MEIENRLGQIIKNIKPSDGGGFLRVKNFVLYTNNPYAEMPGSVLSNLQKFCEKNEVVQVTFLNVSKNETRIVAVYKVSERT